MSGKKREETVSLASYFDMMNALAADYVNMYILEPETDCGSIVKLEGYEIEGIRKSLDNFCYSQMLRVYANDRVYDEDREGFLKELLPEALVKTFEDGKEKLEFDYRVYADGELRYFNGLYTRISKQGESLRLIAGFRNIDSIVSLRKKNRDEGLYNAYSAISDVYLAMHRIDIKANTYSSIKTTDEIMKYTIPGSDNYDENAKSIIKGLSKEASYDSAMEFMDRGTLEERMQGKKHISIGFEGKSAGMCKLHFIKEDEDLSGNLWHVIFAVEVTDEIEFQSAFDVFASGFQNVFRIDLEDGIAKMFKLDGFIAEGIDETDNRFFPYEKVLKQYISSRVHPEDRQMLYEKLGINSLREKFKTKQVHVGNYRILVDGEVHYFQYNYSIMNGTGNIICGFRNIDAVIEEHLETERQKRKEEEAHQNELKEQLTIINTLSRDFLNIYVADLNNGMARAIRIDDSFEVKEITALKNKTFQFDIVVKNWAYKNVHPEDQARVINSLSVKNLQKVLAEQEEYVGNYRNMDKKGNIHNFQFNVKKADDAGKVICGFQNIDTIIEEHIAQEKKQKEIEEAHQKQLREHIEVISSLSTLYSTIFAAEIDTHRYEVLDSVALMGDVAGAGGNFDDVKSNVIAAFMTPDDHERMNEFLDLDTLADRMKDVNTIATEYQNPDGRWFEARFILKSRDDAGKAKEALYVARDITDEKLKDLEQQEQLSHALAAARQASKAKTTFLNSMSHDIRTPMNAIIGFTALAQTHIGDQEQVQDYLAKISTSSTHLLSLINDILDMSRIESGTVKLEEKSVHIPDLLHDLRTMIQGLINSKSQNLYIDTQDVAHEDVITDKLRLNQVLINIVGNAVKFTQPGGDVIIRLAEKPCRAKNYAKYVFTVKDNGIGMSKEFKEHIFDAFTREYSTTKSGVQGTGLGMAITKNIVDMMGGEITVESEEGKGSLFTVTLDLRLANRPVKNEPIPELMGARALVVDDDLNTCRSVSKMLRDIKMRPDWTVSGREAVVRAQDATEIGDEYKVYIIDYLMPDMNGIETVRRIRKVIREDVPIIVLTAYDWADFENEAREAGVTAFVSKPIFMSELREVLTRPAGSKTVSQDKNQNHYDYSDKHILLAEDNELNREIATAILEETGMKVDSVNDGDEAVTAVANAPDNKYDLVLMDIQMPKMDGYTATREIRTLPDNRKANIPIVAMTANAFEEDKRKALESGMNGHIIKPVSIEEIAKVLDEIFGKIEE